MTDKEVIDRIKKVLGSLYDLKKDEAYLRGYRHFEKESLQKSEPLIPVVFEGDVWKRVKVVSALGPGSFPVST